MLLPDVFGDKFFSDFLDDPWNKRFFSAPAVQTQQMRTDVKETETGYELQIELPGYKKEDVNADLKDGYLTISASHSENKDEKDTEGSYIRRERYSGSCSRSFYVGKTIEPEDIHAKFEDGILKLDVPKKEVKKVEEKKSIAIEG